MGSAQWSRQTAQRAETTGVEHLAVRNELMQRLMDEFDCKIRQAEYRRLQQAIRIDKLNSVIQMAKGIHEQHGGSYCDALALAESFLYECAAEQDVNISAEGVRKRGDWFKAVLK